jgi:hypothetical protein
LWDDPTNLLIVLNSLASRMKAMSALGQKQTFTPQKVMSVFYPRKRTSDAVFEMSEADMMQQW